MARIALKIDVDTLRGTREGVPRLLDLLAAQNARATFLFSLGPDHTGRALRRVFRPGFLAKVKRTSVLEHYGLRTLLYGTLLPGPDIGRRAAAEMKAVRADGHEVGIHTWDHVLWQDKVRHGDAAWTERQMQLAYDRFVDVFGERPATHGAAGWQTNDVALKRIDAWGMRYASDGRGVAPYRPKLDGRTLSHVQLPTTLPTLDELIGHEGIGKDNVVAALLGRTEGEADQVFTLHAELEGGLFAPTFATLLRSWRNQGHELVDLRARFEALDADALPVRPLSWGRVPGRSGELVLAT